MSPFQCVFFYVVSMDRYTYVTSEVTGQFSSNPTVNHCILNETMKHNFIKLHKEISNNSSKLGKTFSINLMNLFCRDSVKE